MRIPAPEEAAMRRYLIVANQTLGGTHLARKVGECIASGPCVFYVVVPATPPQEWVAWTEGGARAVAELRLERALARFRALGAEVEGEVGDPRPLEAVADILMQRAFDEILISTLPPGPSRWLRRDLPRRMERRFGLPVTHLVGEIEPARKAS
jgi:hypothetical protein